MTRGHNWKHVRGLVYFLIITSLLFYFFAASQKESSQRKILQFVISQKKCGIPLIASIEKNENNSSFSLFHWSVYRLSGVNECSFKTL